MADKIFEDDELITQRFSCNCLFPGHVLDLSIELADKGSRMVECTLNFYMDGKAPWKYRIRQMWELLWGREGQLCDFILRKEDIPALVGLLNRAVTSSCVSTAGTVLT